MDEDRLEQRAYRHRETGAVMFTTSLVSAPHPDEFEPITPHDAVVENARVAAALQDEVDRHSRDIAAKVDEQNQTRIDTAISAAARLGLTNAEAAILFGVPEIADLPGKVPDVEPVEPT